MSSFEHYKPSFVKKAFIEMSGLAFVIMIFLGIWIEEFRWRMILSAIFLFAILMLEVATMDRKDKEMAKLKSAKLEKGGKHGK